MSNFRDQLARDASEVFLRTEEWAEEVEYFGPSVKPSEVVAGEGTTVLAIIQLDDESGRKLGYQYEKDFDTPEGRRVVRYCWMEIATDLQVNKDGMFLIQAELWSVARIEERDDYLQRILVMRNEPDSSRKQRRF